jgi:signal transduction histidine kinase
MTGLTMTLSLRSRILLTLIPLLALLAVLGGTAIVLLQRLAAQMDAVLRDEYDSVLYMVHLKESVFGIDSSFTLALAGAKDQAHAHEQFLTHWRRYDENLTLEQGNITVSGEEALVNTLTELTRRYRRQGTAFFARSANDPARMQDYLGKGGLQQTFEEIRQTADAILKLNHDFMEHNNLEAHQTARESLVGLVLAVAVGALLGIYLTWRTLHSILVPIRAVIRSAQGIRAGNLDQVIPVTTRDELGQLAQEFNAMARQLRQYRQTDYARLLRAQRTSQATIDSFPDPVLVVDPDGLVEMANPAAQRLFGVTGKGPDQTTHTPWRPPDPLAEPLQQAIQGHRPYLPEEFDRAVALRIDGQDHSFLPHILPIRDPWGYTLGAAVLLHDITRFRLLDQIKSDLVATASHELKTPLTSLRLAHHLLLEEVVGPLTPKQVELLVDARDNAERMLAVVNNLLDLTRLEQGREYLDLQPQSPLELLQAAADVIRPRAEDKGIAIKVEAAPSLPLVVADAERLGHALQNLLDNAVTYTDRGGAITLSAARAEGDGEVILSIADTGVGIPADALPHIFDRFFRIPGQTRGAGTGLGLAIVREIVGAHRGTVTCSSQPGVGTTFQIRLPVNHDERGTRVP